MEKLVSAATPRSPNLGKDLLRLEGVTKRFPGVIALNGVNFDLKAGEVHVLLGENGAGKSTLINLICGTFQADEGHYWYKSQKVAHQSPRHARDDGIGAVFQEFSLAPDLTIEANLFLGRELSRFGILDHRSMHDRSVQILEKLGFPLDVQRRVETLSRAEQQIVEIAKALLIDVNLLILDEPTASLTDHEAERLFEVIAELKSAGVGIIYVSHRMAEIRRLADRITILRDGQKIDTVAPSDHTDSQLVEMMTGRQIDVLYPTLDCNPGKVRLATEKLSTTGGGVVNASIEVHAGEVVGIAGLVGCGKSKLARAIFGLLPVESGKICLAEKWVEVPNPGSMLRNGLCYFPSNRAAEGLAFGRAIRDNVSMAALDIGTFSRNGFLRVRNEGREVGSITTKLQLRPADINTDVENLSGGNRQKVMLSRGVTRDTNVFLFDEPTVGVDVGAKVEIYTMIKDLAEGGAAVVIISSELAEITNLCHRTYVMHAGSVVAEFKGDEITEKNVLGAIFERQNSEKSNSPSGVDSKPEPVTGEML